MRGGLRLQLLLLLAVLLVVGFGPLFFATATYSRVGFQQLQRDNAEALGRSVAARLAVGRERLAEPALLEEMAAQVESDAVQAVALYDRAGRIWLRYGQPQFVERMPPLLAEPRKSRVVDWSSSDGAALAIYVPDQLGGVTTVTRVEPVQARATRLTQLMGLYMVVAALTVLAFAYFALTRWIVRPVIELERGADRVASGSRRLEPLRNAPPELRSLSRSLAQMTERLRDEEEQLRRKVREVEQATRELERAQSSLIRSERLASVGRLAAGLAHEIGNPIAALMGLQDLVQEDDLSPEERRDFVQRMKRETSRIDRVISDLLAFARPNRPERTSEQHCSVAEVVDDVFSLLRPQKDMVAIEFESELDEDLPRAPLSHEELVQVLLNLVMNAADACRRQGHVVVRGRRLEASSGLSIAVEDDGPGIAPQIAGELFEPFVSTKEVGKGTGLGLAVARGLVEAAGGELTWDSDYEPGARFVMTFASREPR